MATYDLSAAPQTGRFIASTANPYIRKVSLDISKLATQNAGDIVKVFPAAAGEFVRNVYVRVITASTTGSSTVTVGDTASGTGWITSVAATATGVTSANGAYVFTQSGTTPFAVTWVGGKYYATLDTIQVVLGATPPANGIIEVYAELLDLGVYGTII